MTVFVDTAALMALISEDDAHYKRANALAAELEAQGVPGITTDWVLAEFLGGASRKRLRQLAVMLICRIQDNTRFQIVPASRASFRAAFDLYRSRMDKEWSLVDCASIRICQTRKISRVFTSDRHFTQAGLEILLG